MFKKREKNELEGKYVFVSTSEMVYTNGNVENEMIHFYQKNAYRENEKILITISVSEFHKLLENKRIYKIT